MAVWSTKFVDDLPDSSFLYIESGGEKDDEGKTKPRSLRHFPYKGSDGKIDLPHLRNALARIPQAKIPSDVKSRLTAKAERLLKNAQQQQPGYDAMRREMSIYADISPYTSQLLQEALAATSADGTCVVRMSSQGGDAFAGMAMRSMLASAQCATQVVIEGACCSAASVAAMGADKISMSESAVMMIHNASAGSFGGAEELASTADMLRAINDATCAAYAARCSMGKDEMAAMMDSAKWFTAAEALDLGLIDEIVPARGVTQSALQNPCQSSNVSVNMDLKALAKKLGLPETATQAEVDAALDARLAPAAAPAQNAPTDLATLVAQEVERVLAARDAAAAASAVGQPTAAEQHSSAVLAAVERFIGEGKIAPAGRDKAIAACGSTAQQLNAAVAYWTNAPRVVAAPVQNAPNATGKITQLTERQKLMCRQSDVSEESFLKRLNGEKA